MKYLLTLIFFLGSLFASEFEKKGFFTSKWCAERGYFRDCPLETFSCGYKECFLDYEIGDKTNDKLALYVHDEGRIYNVVPDGLPRYELDEAVNRNEVSIIGHYDKESNTIFAKEYKAPPPPAKSFFKGCL